ncbi:MAG: hypothetical protein K0S04_773 [Herbinix sp.]|jgi:hypothetical protein|nr:hypothetical protein [Herbinix sp.]
MSRKNEVKKEIESCDEIQRGGVCLRACIVNIKR